MAPPPTLALVKRAIEHRKRQAIIARDGVYSYQDLLDASSQMAAALLGGQKDLRGKRVVYLVPPSFSHVAVQWGIWRAGGVAVPLAEFLPLPQIEYMIEDSDPAILLAASSYKEKIKPLAEGGGRRFLAAERALGARPTTLPRIGPGRQALIIYTSGTTGKPKGVVTTHANIEAQVTSLVSAWEWTEKDHILEVLPLNHVHGIINVLSCALYSGATCEILPGFDAAEVWRRFRRGGLTVFMAVPTIYAKLIAVWKSAPPKMRSKMSASLAKMRLMVSGSAALPKDVFSAWKEISGQALLERYGMTEVGMVLSNPVHGERMAGYVGTALPRVKVRLLDEKGKPARPGIAGEILVRGPGVFSEYWRKPKTTRSAFRDGWFRTGDLAVFENGRYRILGRSSVDIIKSGGFKLSALEIEDTLRSHPGIDECAVVGLPDREWGERVAAAVVLKSGRRLTLASLREWAKERLTPYQVPSRLLFLEQLPRNPMGKVSKAEIVRLFPDKTDKAF